jgi:hypothetical protein
MGVIIGFQRLCGGAGATSSAADEPDSQNVGSLRGGKHRWKAGGDGGLYEVAPGTRVVFHIHHYGKPWTVHSNPIFESA